jgi:CO/xanthine dehydrogenase FAD-binding subunit
MNYLPKFEYIVPESADDLRLFLQEHGEESRILAGGTDLLINLPTANPAPRYLVDITRISALSSMRDEEGGQIFIGATTTHTALSENVLIGKEVLFLSEAAASVGSVQIRNAGTVGGNLVNGSPAADTIPPLVALDATALIVSYRSEKCVPVSAFTSGPYQTKLLREEFVAGIAFPKLPPGAGTCFLKLGRRQALSISRISIAVALVLGNDERIEEARICPGAVMPVPARMSEAEGHLIGRAPGPDVFSEASEKVSHEAVKISGMRPSTPYKEPVLQNLTKQALAIAAERCAESRRRHSA